VTDTPPRRVDELDAIARSPARPAQERTAAAIALGRLATPDAERVVVGILTDARRGLLPDAPVGFLAEALTALGRIGSPSSLPVFDHYAAPPDRQIGGAAQFGAALIAYRFRLPGHDLPVPPRETLLDVATNAGRRVEVTVVDPAASQAVLESLRYQPFGISLRPGPLVRLHCRTDEHVVCLNEEFTPGGSVDSLAERKALLAVVAFRSREGEPYSVSYVALAAPAPASRRVDILAPRPNGRPQLAGFATIDSDQLRFSLRSIDRPGVRAMAIDGVLQRGELTVTSAVVATIRRRAPRPRQLGPDSRAWHIA
jgi:hypothetical protein